MKEKEMYLADLRSLKENISNKIMEAIQDLEAKNLKKIEKKIEKASQKIALGLIKASLKNAELLTRKITNAIGSPGSPKSGNTLGTKRGRPSLKEKELTLPGFESSTLKTVLEKKPVLLKKRGRPAKTISSLKITKLKAVESENSTSPKKRGRPFGTKAGKVSAKNPVGEAATARRGRPRVLSLVKPMESDTLESPKRRGRPRVLSPKSDAVVDNSQTQVKGRRGRPAKVQATNSESSDKEVINEVKRRGRKPKEVRTENPPSTETV